MTLDRHRKVFFHENKKRAVKGKRKAPKKAEAAATRGPDGNARSLFDVIVCGNDVQLTVVDPKDPGRERRVVIPSGPGPLGLEMKTSAGIVGLLVVRASGRAAAAGMVSGEVIIAVERFEGNLEGPSHKAKGVTSCVYSYYSGKHSLYAGPKCLDGHGPEEFLEHPPPVSMSDAQMQERISLPIAQKLIYLLRSYSYQSRDVEVWPKMILQNPRWPSFTFGEINGHHEEAGHTWYRLLCHLKVKGVATRHWCVQRRLHHLRRFLHDVIKSDANGLYKFYFGDVTFAGRGGLAGTTNALSAWLKTWSAAINTGQVCPRLVALTLLFLEAPPLFDSGGKVVQGSSPEEVRKRAIQASEEEEEGSNIDPSALFWITQGGAHPMERPVGETGLERELTIDSIADDLAKDWAARTGTDFRAAPTGGAALASVPEASPKAPEEHHPAQATLSLPSDAAAVARESTEYDSDDSEVVATTV
eukprot:TRINITY_DN19828_c0_g1_i1.p1 TRINITY_DN19828_c0_g1~~TRINITY_DN19828_c0_g1_i1.p1  ORF type:complete len:487 (+),score=59.06 TRINITY_DN19828_c0_g1_i1:43-1461(+)